MEIVWTCIRKEHHMSTGLNCIKNGIVGGIILFIWSAISWMILPWHMATLRGFSNEIAVIQTVTSNSPQSGIYILPLKQRDVQQGQAQQSPQVFASINFQGMGTSMAEPMLICFLNQVITAILVAWLLSKATGLNYFGRVGFIVVFALAASLVTHIPYWNWFAFDTTYTLMIIVDTLIGWLLAGLVMAKLVKT